MAVSAMTMKSLLLAVILMHGASAHAADSTVPPGLATQIERLTSLVSDGHAVGLPDATQSQTVVADAHTRMTLALFVVEGFGGGNTYSQHLAVFTVAEDASGAPYYSLLDTLPVGGKGWRMIANLDARVSPGPSDAAWRLEFDVMENTADDAPGFPSRQGRLVLALEGGRLAEVKTGQAPPRAEVARE
jgi:hypothetical protein